MTPRPHPKRKFLWIGILVLGFLAFGWVGSMTGYSEGLYWQSSGRTRFVSVLQAHSKVGVIFGKGISWLDPGVHYYKGLVFDPLWLPPATSIEREFGTTAIWVSHWFLILLFLIPWSAFLAWRVRKQR